MGINLKDVIKPEYDQLVVDKRKQMIKKLTVIVVILFILIVAAIVLKIISDTNNNKATLRAKFLTSDMQNLSQKIITLGNENRINPERTLIGTSLENEPVVLYEGGEEYRYGYYLLTAEEALSINSTLNMKEERYIVNYTTGDVVNVAGIQIGRRIYYTLADITAIAENKEIPSNYTINIASAADMEKIRQNPAGAYKLSANIDMSQYSNGNGWEPIAEFSGSIEGRGYTISNLKVSKTNKDYCGLFGEITNGAKVSNLVINKANIRGAEYTGIIAGYCSGIITNCRVEESTVNGSSFVGGLVGGCADGSIIKSSVISSIISGKEAVGGFVGAINSGNISECFAEGNITGLEAVGGFVGKATPDSNTAITACYSNTQLNGNSAIGGFIGSIEAISSSGSLDLLNVYAKGAIQSGESVLGGFNGKLNMLTGSTVRFDSVYTIVDVIPEIATRGGFIGQSGSTDSANLTVDKCLWEKDPLLDINLKDIGDSNKTNTFTSKTPEEMRIKVTFGNWDIEVWKIDNDNDTPSFRWQ